MKLVFYGTSVFLSRVDLIGRYGSFYLKNRTYKTRKIRIMVMFVMSRSQIWLRKNNTSMTTMAVTMIAMYTVSNSDLFMVEQYSLVR